MSLTQQELAEKINETMQVVSNWEREYTFPSLEDVYKLSMALNRTTDYFIIGENNNPFSKAEGFMSSPVKALTKSTGERIKRLRIERGWGLEDLASRVGRAKTTLSEIENNKKNAGRKLIEALSIEFGVSTDYLLGMSDDDYFVYKFEGNKISIDMGNLSREEVLTEVEYSLLTTLLNAIDDRMDRRKRHL